MKTTHFNLIMIALLAVVGGLGYFSFSTIKYGTIPVKEEANVQSLSAETPSAEEVATTATDPVVSTETATPATEITSSSTHQALIASLQAMLDSKVVLNAGKSNGPEVKNVQDFLNIYDKKNVAANSNFGPATTSRVKEFQKANSVPVTGNVGPQTLQKMVDWLKTQ